MKAVVHCSISVIFANELGAFLAFITEFSSVTIIDSSECWTLAFFGNSFARSKNSPDCICLKNWAGTSLKPLAYGAVVVEGGTELSICISTLGTATLLDAVLDWVVG